MWSRAGVTSCQNDFVTEGKKQMKSTSEINDGFETILFHTLLPPPDEEAEDGRERKMEREREKVGGGGRAAQWQAGKTFSISLTISCVITDVV